MRRTDDYVAVVPRNYNDILPPNTPTRSPHTPLLELLQSIGAPTISFVENKTAMGGGRKEKNSTQGDKVVVTNEDKSESSYDRLGFIQGHELFPTHKVDDLMEWKSIKSIGPGLYNHGNTCYINSTLQCLLYIPALAQHLSQEEDEYIAVGGIELKKGQERVSFDALALIARLASHMHGGGLQENGKNRKAAVIPTEIIRNIRYLGKQFVPGRQEDAHEFLRQFVDKMAESYLVRRRVKSNAPYRLGETTPIHRIFAGYLRSRVTCLSCGFKSDSFDMIMDLCLGMGKKVRSVKHALQRFLSPETLSTNNHWKCSKCNKVVCTKKQFTINVAPRVLVIQLKRFKYGIVGQKIRHRLHYPLFLSVPTSGGEGNVKYALCGVMVHAGQCIGMGHYFAYVRGANRLWYLMDDDMVQQARTSDVLNQEAYILFYYRTDLALHDASTCQPSAPMQQKVEAKLPVQKTPSQQPLSSSEKEEDEEMEEDEGRLDPREKRSTAKRADLINMQHRYRSLAGRSNTRAKRLAWVKKSILEKFMYPGRGKWMRFDGRLKVSPGKKREDEVTDCINSTKLKVLKRDLSDKMHFNEMEKEGFHVEYVESRNIQGANVNQLVDGDDSTCKTSKRDNEVRKPIGSSTLSSTMKSSMNGRLGGKIDRNQKEVWGMVTLTVGVDKFQRATTSVSNARGGGCMEDLGGWDGLDEEEGAKLQRDRTLQAEINTLIQNSESRFNLKHERDAWDMALDKGNAKKVKVTKEPIKEGTNKLFQLAQYKKQKFSVHKSKGSCIKTS